MKVHDNLPVTGVTGERTPDGQTITKVHKSFI